TYNVGGKNGKAKGLVGRKLIAERILDGIYQNARTGKEVRLRLIEK
ncbi:unnamed protein product, partial [marine sediment metagenome]